MINKSDIEPLADAPPLIPAATVVLLRDRHGQLETLMLKRNAALKSFAGAWVFPGGRVDEADKVPGGDEIDHARQAATREALEETGLGIKPGAMTVLSYWEPGLKIRKGFSTWFFLCAAPEGEVQIDHGEIHDHRWMPPGDILDAHRQQEMILIPPTFVTLHDLAKFVSVADALVFYKEQQPQKYITNFFMRAEGFVSLWPGDVAYESNDLEALGRRHRLLETPEGWNYIKD